jgi:hypothetical protein
VNALTFSIFDARLLSGVISNLKWETYSPLASSSKEESQDISIIALLKLKWLWWLFNRFTFSPNLFLFCEPFMPNLPYAGRKGWWKLTKLNPTGHLPTK